MIKIREIFINLLQVPLSPIMLLEIVFSIFFLLVSFLFFVSVVFLNPRSTIQASTWRIPNNASVGDYTSQRLNSDDDALMRPLFNKNRRPALIDKSDANISETNLNSTETPNNINLVAIAKFNGEDRAFISTPSSPNGAWYKTGDALEEWTIKKINSTNVVIKKADIDSLLVLYTNNGAASFAKPTSINPLGQVMPQNSGSKNIK